MMNSGQIQPTRPSLGSWLTYGLGTENQNLPGFVVLCPGKPVVGPQLWSNSFLPGIYQGTHINNKTIDPKSIIAHLTNKSLGREPQRTQLDLLQRMNELHLADRPHDAQLEARIQSLEMAFRMQFEALDAFDIGKEPATVRDQYGPGEFADACLIARRLAERGVRIVQVYYGNNQPWDDHADINNHRDHAKKSDRPIAALLTDLKARGLLDDTLVVWGGEFGRTPTSQGSKGRDHHSLGFTMWLAGGGVKGGHVHGATDEFGFVAIEDKVHVHDLHATILHLLGIDHEKLTYRYSGRDFRLTDVHGEVVTSILA
jgi:arylsulfatase A-like enzyme